MAKMTRFSILSIPTDKITEFYKYMAMLVKTPGVMVLEFEHREECPLGDGCSDLDLCTCGEIPQCNIYAKDGSEFEVEDAFLEFIKSEG